ncbi:MAG: RNA methyltransferase [Ruminococcaceae bacterium]|nr:RNA methyltransferase [Oscillospiraceae bacterium]
MIFRKEVITSRNNPLVKWASSLAEKKGRSEHKCFIAEGEKLTLEALKAGLPLTHIFVLEDKSEQILERLSEFQNTDCHKSCEVILLSDSAFSKISTEKAPQGIISVIKYLDFFSNLDIIYKEDFFILKGERVLSLYSLRDPGNLGAVIRSATAFGVEHIVLSSDCADIYNPKTVRAAMGSLFKVKVSYVGDYASFVEAARANGRRVFAAELTDGAKSLSNIELSSDDIFIIGNEGHGISPEISEKCTDSVYIPISDKTESLNASVAAAVFMWEQNKL